MNDIVGVKFEQNVLISNSINFNEDTSNSDTINFVIAVITECVLG
jgi:hypothetical protein